MITNDELRAIESRAHAAGASEPWRWNYPSTPETQAHILGMDPHTTLRLVEEVRRLRDKCGEKKDQCICQGVDNCHSSFCPRSKVTP